MTFLAELQVVGRAQQGRGLAPVRIVTGDAGEFPAWMLGVRDTPDRVLRDRMLEIGVGLPIVALETQRVQRCPQTESVLRSVRGVARGALT